jgi:hypothetical protein
MRKNIGEVFGLVFIVFIFLFLTGFASCAKTQSQQAGDPQSLVMTACTVCHDTQRICDALSKKDKDAWTQTVTRMKDKGAAVPAENIPQVIDYLAGLKPGSPPICK